MEVSTAPAIHASNGVVFISFTSWSGIVPFIEAVKAVPVQIEKLRIVRQSAHGGDKVVSSTHRPPLPPR